MKFTSHKTLTTSLACQLLILTSWAAAALCADAMSQIELRAQVAVNTPMVRLSDIAHIRSQDPELRRQLQCIEIVRSPLMGRTRWVMKDQVERRLHQQGIDAQQYHLLSSGPTKVSRKTTTLAADKIRSAVVTHIQKYAPWKPEQLRIGAVKFQRDLNVPPGKVSITVQAPKHSDWLGAIPFRVKVNVNGHLVHKLSVATTIEVWSDVVLAAKPLGKYQPITQQCVKVVRMNLARVPASAILNPKDVMGQRARRNIAINTVLRSDQIEMPPLVKIGDLVQAVAETADLKITVKAMVKESGGKGEMVRVLNLRSKKIVYAQVVDAQTVSVDF